MNPSGPKAWRRSRLAGLLPALVCLAGPVQADGCAALVQRITTLDLSQASDLRAPNGTPLTSLYAACDAKNTFLGAPLPSFQGRPLKCSTDPNRVARLIQFPDKTVLFEAKAAVDADGSPVSCGPHKSQTDQCQTWLEYDRGSPRRFVDSEQVPFVVVPTNAPGGNLSFMRASGIGKGDLAVVVFRDRCVFGVVGDVGPYFRLGELSLAAHAALGNPQCADAAIPCTRLVNGGSGRGIAAGVTYIVFPGARPQPLRSDTVLDDVAVQAPPLFERFLDRFGRK